MTCLGFDLITTDSACYAIRQGATFDRVKFYRPEDLTGAVPIGVIRNNYKDVSGSTILATFTFPAIVYAPVTISGETVTRSLIWPKLSDEVTAALPVPKPIEKTNGVYVPGSSCWVYGISVQKSNGDTIWIARGLVGVMAGVV